MRGLLIGLLLAVAAAVYWLWGAGGLGQIGAWAAEHQRDFQNQMALALRAVRSGQPAAIWTLLAVCFAYGFFHAIGPGHGKVLISGYGLARRVAMLRLSVISLIASLGQAVTAVVLVYAGVLAFRLSREQLVGAADNVMAPVSYAMIVAVGAWLLVRGLRRLMARPAPPDHAPHGGGHCDSCGHKHGPTVEEAGAVTSLREAALLIGGIAIRPCTGALFVLVITLGMGIPLAGIAGAFAMALGTAVVTIGVGIGAVGLRGGFLQGAAVSGLTTRVMPLVEIAAGILVVLGAGGLLLRAL
ncbi:MAG: hypothetical protein WBB25_07045 [Sulfitobacter sp.]